MAKDDTGDIENSSNLDKTGMIRKVNRDAAIKEAEEKVRREYEEKERTRKEASFAKLREEVDALDKKISNKIEADLKQAAVDAKWQTDMEGTIKLLRRIGGVALAIVAAAIAAAIGLG